MAHLQINKFLILLMAPENPRWSDLLTVVKQETILRVTRTSASTLTNWRRGRAATVESERRIVGNLRTFVKEDLTRYADSLRRPDGSSLSVFADCLDEFIARSGPDGGESRAAEDIICLAQFFNMDPNHCRRLIDEAIYSIYPVLPSLYWHDTLEGRALADGALRGVCGSYAAYVERDGVWMRADMRVRYRVKIGDGWVIRAKMNFPALPGTGFGVDSWEYDGVLSIQSGTLFWTFEMRDPSNADYIYLVTKLPHVIDQKRCLGGHYLTAGQDLPTRSIVFGRALLVEQDVDYDTLDKSGARRPAPPIGPLTKKEVLKLNLDKLSAITAGGGTVSGGHRAPKRVAA